MILTKWLKLKKPEQEEFYDVDDFNYNADIIDENLQKQSDELDKHKKDDKAHSTIFDKYLPLTGGTMTGTITSNATDAIFRDSTSSYLAFCGSNTWATGAGLLLTGKDYANHNGSFHVRAYDGTNVQELIGKPNGELTWDGSFKLNNGRLYSTHLMNTDNSKQMIICGNSSLKGARMYLNSDTNATPNQVAVNADSFIVNNKNVVRSINGVDADSNGNVILQISSGSYLPLAGGTMTGNISYNKLGECYIGNGSVDATPTVNGALSNLVISSWHGISFTTNCNNQTYTNKTAVGIDCRSGVVYGVKFVGYLQGDCSGSSTSCTGNSATATKATQDSNGANIASTYIKALSVNGRTITYTKGNGATGTITTQDTNTTYDLSPYVKLATAQTISAQHNFSKGVQVNGYVITVG